MDYAPIVRIALRYLAGGLFMGSTAVGDQLAADPDIVAMCSLALAGVVEAFYAMAKIRGGKT